MIPPRLYANTLDNSLNWSHADFIEYPSVEVLSRLQSKYDVYNVVNQLIDMEETLGITRDDWILIKGRFFFTNDDMACLFKLTITTDL